MKRPNQDTVGGARRRRDRKKEVVHTEKEPDKAYKENDCCVNKGNTCYVAAALRSIRQAVRSGKQETAGIKNKELRNALEDMTRENWEKFLKQQRLGGRHAKQDDAALFAEEIVEKEKLLTEMFKNEIQVKYTCQGCYCDTEKEKTTCSSGSLYREESRGSKSQI